MRYQMRKRSFSLGDAFDIKDDRGENVFFVQSRALSLGSRLSFQTADRKEIALLKTCLFAWRPTVRVFHQGRPVARVQKKWLTLLRNQFLIDVVGGDAMIAKGSVFEHEYTFLRHDQPIANVSKKWFTIADAYGVDIVDGEDDVLILAMALGIDLLSRRSRHSILEGGG